MSDATTIRQLADQYRRDRVEFDDALREFDENEDGDIDEALEEAMHVASMRCQDVAFRMKGMTPANHDERLERCAVLIDANIMADEPIEKLRAILAELEGVEGDSHRKAI